MRGLCIGFGIALVAMARILFGRFGCAVAARRVAVSGSLHICGRIAAHFQRLSDAQTVIADLVGGNQFVGADVVAFGDAVYGIALLDFIRLRGGGAVALGSGFFCRSHAFLRCGFRSCCCVGGAAACFSGCALACCGGITLGNGGADSFVSLYFGLSGLRDNP